MKPAILLLVLALAVAGPAGPVASQTLSGLTGVAIMNGKCQRLIVAGRDASSRCEGKVTNTAYRSGRSGFTFIVGDLAVVTFTGASSPAVGDGAMIRLDHVIFTLIGTGTRPNAVPARGSCRYTNPFAGPGHVDCSASTRSGDFFAKFLSDGHKPEIKQF